jgi:superfamily II DNA or RNA helicase/predicted RNA methylase
MERQGKQSEQMLFDFNESEIESHIVQSVLPSTIESIMARREYIAEHGNDPENIITIQATETYRSFGGWSNFDTRLITSERIRINREATELLKRDEKKYSEEELEVLRRYSGFGGLSTNNERGVLYDYYTSPPIANMTWQLLHKINSIRKNSRILEPSCGTGVFIETAPEGVKLYGVELDERAASVASALFPEAVITRSSFEGYYASDANSIKFDHVIGNVPFGERTIQTAFLDLPEEKSLDRYFIKRSIDILAENGTLALITHPGIMENESSHDFREELIKKAQFMGAIRLNDKTFYHTHTTVQPVIMFFKKYPYEIEQRIASHPDSSIISELYQNLPYLSFIEGIYFKDYPKHIMGDVLEGEGQWGGDIIKGDTLQSTLQNMVDTFTPYIAISEYKYATVREKYDIVYEKERADTLALTKEELERVENKILTSGALKTIEDTVYLLNDEYRWDNIEAGKRNLVKKLEQINIICEQVKSIRGSFQHGERQVSKQAETADTLEQYRQAYGQYPLDDKEIKSFLRRHPAVRGVYDSFVTPKSEILTTNIYENNKPRLDGYARSIGVLKYLQSNLIEGTEENLKKYYPDEYEKLINEMGQNPDIFLTHNKIWQLREDFISGNAYMKIDYIQESLNNESNNNTADKLKYGIAELEKAVGWVTIEDAQFTPHSSWIPEYVINEWIEDYDGLGKKELSNKEKKVSKNDEGKWGIRYQTDKTVVSSDNVIKERYEGQWEEAADPVIYYLNMQKQRSRYYNTEIFNKENNELFKSWISGNPKYREMLEQKYNRIFNAEIGVPVKTYPVYIEGWLEEKKTIKSHQLQSVNHLYNEGKGISALGTGFGKTLVGTALAALLQQEQKIKRAFFQVPNNKVKDWVAEIKSVLPDKKIGFIDPETRGYSSRELRYSQYQNIINNRYDIIIMPESSASEIQLSPEKDQEITNRVINVQLMNITAEKSQRKVETMKESAARKMVNGKTNKVIYFEDFGCDAIFVDEAHRYKNLFSSSLSRDTGMNDGRQSAKAMSLFKKTEYIRNNNNDKNVFLFTATPLINSPLEYYNMLMLVAPEELQKFNINNINEFINNFADIENGTTYDWQTGQIINKRILTGFKNLRTLQNIFFKYTDYQNDPKKINLEKPDSQNKPNIIAANAEQVMVIKGISSELEQYTKASKEERAEEFPGQNFLTFYSKLRTASLDLSLYAPGDYGKWDNPKFKAMVKNAFNSYSQTKGGQVIFCDRVFSGDGTFNIHDKIKEYLIDAGFKANEIIIINGFTKSGAPMSDSALEKETSEAVEAFNKGKYKVIIGTTACIGEGLNLQENSSAIHHADIPFRPSDFIQRNGRIDRQGNTQENVELHSYMASGTIDNYSVSLVQRKSNWIDQLLKTKSNVFLNPDDEHFVDAEEMLLALTEEWGDPEQAEERRKHMEQIKSEKMIEMQNQERKDCLTQLSLLRGAAYNYKGDKGSATYQARIQKGMRIAKMLENNPTFNDKTALQKKEPFIYDRSKDICIFKGDYAIYDDNVYEIDSLNIKKMTIHGERISERKRISFVHNNSDYDAEFSEQVNVTKKYSYENYIYLTNIPKEEKEHISSLTNKSFYDISSERFKEKYYQIHLENSEDKIPKFYIKENKLIISNDIVRNDDNKIIKPLNPFNEYDREQIIQMIERKKYEWGDNRNDIVEKLYNIYPDIYTQAAKTDKTITDPIQKYIESMEISDIGDFKSNMKSLVKKYPVEFEKDSFKAANMIMQNLDDETKKALNGELVQAGCAGPEKMKKMFDTWAGLSPEMSKRVVFTGVSIG